MRAPVLLILGSLDPDGYLPGYLERYAANEIVVTPDGIGEHLLGREVGRPCRMISFKEVYGLDRSATVLALQGVSHERLEKLRQRFREVIAPYGGGTRHVMSALGSAIQQVEREDPRRRRWGH